MLHPSLLELSEVAETCDNLATVRGVIAESHDLMRNAVRHEAPAREVTSWYSAIITALMHSEGALDASGGVRLVLSGAVGRGDALPSSTITWLELDPAGSKPAPGSTDAIVALLRDMGLEVAPTSSSAPPATRSQWLERIDASMAQPGKSLAFYADAGTWALRRVNERCPEEALLRGALALKPPHVLSRDGLPEAASVVSVRDQLLAPIVGLARWAGVCAECPSAATPERLRFAQHAQVLSAAEVASLLQAFEAAQRLELERWTQRVQAAHTTPASLTAIQRSIFGAAAREVADVMRAVAARTEHRLD